MIEKLATLIGGLVLFAVLHSLLAVDRVRQRLEASLGRSRSVYRLLYNVVSLALLLPILVWSRGDYPVVWNVQGALRYAFWCVQGAALLVFLLALRRFDLAYFAGFRQLAGKQERGGLQTHSVHRLCRHPAYFSSCVFFSAWSTMDLRWLVIAVWLWVYSWIGSWFEERKLLERFGDDYARYCERRPRLLPRFWRRGPSSASP